MDSPLPPPLNLANLEALSVLGRGAKGVVFLVRTGGPNGPIHALKTIYRSSISKPESSPRRIWSERDVLLSLRHPLLPSLHGVLETDRIVAFAIDRCPGGDLNALRRRQTEQMFSDDIIRFYAAELVLALDHLHSLGIVYLMLVDFDLSIRLPPPDPGATDSHVFTSPVSVPAPPRRRRLLSCFSRDVGVSPEIPSESGSSSCSVKIQNLTPSMVATRSRITGDDRAPSDHVSDSPLPPPHFYHNPHQGLKEKMKALTAMYEQHKIKTHRTSITNLPVPDSTRKKRSRGLEDDDSAMRENIKPDFVAKENRIAVLSCPKKVMVPRKLSLGAPSVSRKVGGELGVIPEKGQAGSRIMVFVRLRPMSKKEKEAGSRSCVKIMNKKDVYLTEFASETDYLRLKRLRGRHFCFDTAFPDTTSQQEVYSTTTSELVEGVLQGRNGSVFCYGATGAGKTYTMLGMVENPGVMVLAIKDLFAKIRQRSYDGNHLVHLSYLEVYNETVRDLLSPGRPLILREDKQGIIAAGLTQYRAYSTDEVMALLHQGNQNRTTEPTRANETSSRSHAILQVVAEFQTKDSVNVVNRVGKLSLIDLAGSERALATDQRTLRSLEGANINRSLLALSSCINALVEGKKHIPYRNSKLTQLLKDSLGGPCNTVMIANISPSNLSFGETQNTLHWADRAKEIKTKACIIGEEAVQVPESATDQAKLVLQLQKENSELRQQLVLHQHKLFTIQAQSLAANASPMPLSPLPSTTPCSTQKKTKRPLLSGNCFSTPESRRRGTTDDTTVKDLQRTIKALEATIQRLNKEHTLQIKQKDDFIRELIIKNGSEHIENGDRRAVTRASLCKGVRGMTADGELKSPSHRFTSPSPAAKKRSFWETGVNSPSVSARKTRSQVKEEIPPAPSMLLQLAYHTFWFVFMLGPHVAYHILQPGFARQRR